MKVALVTDQHFGARNDSMRVHDYFEKFYTDVFFPYIDANGIVNVSAKDKGTGKEQQIQIQASGGLSDTDIEKMVDEAKTHADEDKNKKESVEVRNQADSMVYSTEKSLGEHGEKLEANEKDNKTKIDFRQGGSVFDDLTWYHNIHPSVGKRK